MLRPRGFVVGKEVAVKKYVVRLRPNTIAIPPGRGFSTAQQKQN
jgi:hypothetical protein